jgi:quinol monooxygenase YgiN
MFDDRFDPRDRGDDPRNGRGNYDPRWDHDPRDRDEDWRDRDRIRIHRRTTTVKRAPDLALPYANAEQAQQIVMASHDRAAPCAARV